LSDDTSEYRDGNHPYSNSCPRVSTIVARYSAAVVDVRVPIPAPTTLVSTVDTFEVLSFDPPMFFLGSLALEEEEEEEEVECRGRRCGRARTPRRRWYAVVDDEAGERSIFETTCRRHRRAGSILAFSNSIGRQGRSEGIQPCGEMRFCGEKKYYAGGVECDVMDFMIFLWERGFACSGDGSCFLWCRRFAEFFLWRELIYLASKHSLFNATNPMTTDSHKQWSTTTKTQTIYSAAQYAAYPRETPQI
jgi:hypothetical protein